MSSAPLLVVPAVAFAGINPYIVGGGILLLLVLLMVALLSFGAGRDHT